MKTKPAGGYHLTPIPQGSYGDLDKIYEEVEELKDADAQGNRLMTLMELSDIMGAIRGYLEIHHPEMSLTDLIIMADATQRAFASGDRK
jgi:hypothetical protein